MQNKHTMMIARGETAVEVELCSFCSNWQDKEPPCPYYKELSPEGECARFAKCGALPQRLESLLV